MWKPLILALSVITFVVGSISVAFAQRPDTRAMSCEMVRALVHNHGSVVVTTGSHTYARVVSGYGFCNHGQYLQTKLAPTQDHPTCHIGYQCREKIVDKNF